MFYRAINKKYYVRCYINDRGSQFEPIDVSDAKTEYEAIKKKAAGGE